MSMHIRVVVNTKNLTDEKEFQGKLYGWQSAGIYNGGDFPMPFRVNVRKGDEYEPGEYTIAPKSFVLDSMGNLKLKSIKLLAISGSSATQPVRKAG